ncbi:hypothetical protein OSB04_002343 [Centaurea solstitialis]|uniref:Uncharacterized protein n=1 Tax=Centaurea solstitialis TaxID=347529 RepID=A0AA38WMP2_9ASTR|nr:hypothetical protein OSB04_002343 [Centaurea solstitialis]
MASMRLLARKIQMCRTIAFRRTLTPSNPPPRHLPFHNGKLLTGTELESAGTFKHHVHPYHDKSWGSTNVHGLNFLPAMLAGFVGFGAMDIAYADAPEQFNNPLRFASVQAATGTPLPPESPSPPKSPSPPESPATNVNMEAIAKKERVRLEELLKSKGMQYGSYPRFTVAVKGQKVTIKFQIPPTCDIALLISKIVAHLGVKVEEAATGSDMALRAWDSGVACQLKLSRPAVQKEAVKDQGSSDANSNDGDLCILLFRSLISSDKPISAPLPFSYTKQIPHVLKEMEFIKQGSFTTEELDALVSVLKLAGAGQRSTLGRGDTSRTPSVDRSVTALEGMGVKIYGLKEPKVDSRTSEISWENIAGYNQQKRYVTLLKVVILLQEVKNHVSSNFSLL